ncbi:MAG TPA: hypothetical protein VFS43_15035 [Polyangiaceae bacterium]|nr:hypothetical protein [Polyangiaceae bacterium]
MSTPTQPPPDATPPLGALAAARGLLEELPADEVRPPPMPVDRMVAEALALSVSAESARDQLLAKGLSPRQLADLPLLANALAEAQARLTPLRSLRRSESELALEAEAVDLRAEMMTEARFVLRKDADARAALGRVQKGSGLDDLVQDLRELAVLIEQNEAAFEKAGTEPRAKAARARSVASRLAAYVATRRGADRASAGAFETRDRAATLLADTMADIRACAAFALRKQPRLLAKFRCVYKARRKNGRKAPEAPAPGAQLGPDEGPGND